MKKQIALAVAAMSIVAGSGSAVIAQTKTPTTTTALSPTVSTTPSKTATQSGSLIDKEVANIKEKVENTVAELRKKDRKAVAGIITDIKSTGLTIRTPEDVDYEIKRDDTLTKVYQVTATKKEIKFTDLKKGSYVIVTGPILDKSVDANTVYQDVQYIVKSGKITEVNKDDFYIKVITSTKDTITLDIENGTTMTMMDIKSLEAAKVGFSKLKEGDTIHFTVKRTGDEKEQNRYSVERLLIIPQEYFLK